MEKPNRYLPGDARYAPTRMGSRNSRTSIDSQMDEEPARAPTLFSRSCALGFVLLLAVTGIASYRVGAYFGARQELPPASDRAIEAMRAAPAEGAAPPDHEPSVLHEQPAAAGHRQHAMRSERAKKDRGRRLLGLPNRKGAVHGRAMGRADQAASGSPLPPSTGAADEVKSGTRAADVRSGLLTVLCHGTPVYARGYVGWGSPGLFSMLNSVADE